MDVHMNSDHTLSERKERRVAAEEKYAIALEAEDWKAVDKLGAQIVSYTPEMVAETKRLFDLMGVAWIEARWKQKEQRVCGADKVWSVEWPAKIGMSCSTVVL